MANKRFNGMYNGATAGVQKATRDAVTKDLSKVPNLNNTLNRGVSDVMLEMGRRAGRDALNGVTTGGAYKALKEKYAKNQPPTRGSAKPRTKSTK